MNKDFAIMQAAFLSANKISPLSSLQKSDWDKVSKSVLAALRDVTLQKGNTEDPKKTLLCAVWLKLLGAEAEEDIEVTWRESPFFALQNGLPDLNRVVFLELLQSTSSENIFARLLLRLPPSQIYPELQNFAQHISRSPVREEDVIFFLDVWQELWRISGVENDSTEEMFIKEASRLCSNALQRPAKRLKLDTQDLSCSDILYILLHALRDLKDQINTAEIGFRALSISLNALYTSFLIDQGAGISTKEKLEILSQIATIREKNSEKLSPEMIADSLKDLTATQAPARFKPMQIKLAEASAIIAEVITFWFNNGVLKVEDKSNPSYSAFKLKLSLGNVIEALDRIDKTIDYAAHKMLFDSLTFPNVEVSPDVAAKITMSVISHKMDDYLDFALLFSGEQSWAVCDENYIDFLEKNRSAFRDQTAVVQLTRSIVGKLGCGPVDVSCYRKLMKVTADIFSGLNLNEKNKVLAALIEISTRGFFGSNVPPAVTTSFKQELNMAFNCIIQGGGGASASSNLSTAVSLVARVAFQNPEAAVKAMCSSAISNKGAFTIMAKILQQLPGLSGRLNDSMQDRGGKDLLCKCVKDVVKAKQMSQEEKEQLVKFLCLLMEPVEVTEGRGQSFLLPQRVICTFVLPNLALGCVDLDLSLQLLHSALCLPCQDSTPHWLMLCSPFPLLFVLAQLHNHTLRREQPSDHTNVQVLSMETRESLVAVLTAVGQVVGAEVSADPDSWSRALFWLYDKTEDLDWTVRFLLKPVWGEHFKNEVPASLLAVCDLPEQEWSGVDLAQYGPGTGLLAWIECCCISDTLQSTMLSCLSLDQSKPDHVGMFSKGLLVALTQTLPCCSPSQWSLLLRALRSLIDSGRLYVPFSLEYCDYLPLLDLRRFACELRLSVLLLRVFQLLCGSSCAHWLSQDNWGHVGTLYAHAVREMITALKTKLPLTSAVKDTMINHNEAVEKESVPSKEVLFVLSQIFCHVQHIQVMLPEGQSEPLFLSSLELLSHYEAVMGTFPESSSALESDNTRHFFTTITENLQNQEMKSVLQQKIAQLVLSAA